MRAARPRTPATSAARSSGSRSRPATSRRPRRTTFGGAYTVPAGNLFPVGHGRGRGPRSTRWASATRSGSRSTRTTSRTSPTTRRTRTCRSSSAARRAPAASRSCASPRTTAGRSATRPTCRTTSGTSTRRPRFRARRRPRPTSATTRPAARRTRPAGSRTAGPRSTPDSSIGPPVTNPEIWYSYRDNSAPPNGPQGTPCFASYAAGPRTAEPGRCLSAALPGALHRRRRPARHGAVQLRPAQPEPDEVPALLGRGLHRRRVHAGHAARGPARLERRCPQDQQHAALRPGAGNADAAVALRQPDGHGVRP